MNEATKDISDPVQATLFADDLLICCEGKSPKIVINQLQKAIHNLETWSKQTGLKFSTTKTKAIHFTKNRKYQTPPYLELNKQKIDYNNEIKFLGMIMDRKLSWNSHIKQLKTDCLKRLNILKITANYTWGANRDILLTLYRTLIRSKLDYGCFLYSTASKTNLKLLNPIHNQGIRLATGAFRTSPITSILNEADEPTLEERRDQLALRYAIRLSSKTENPAFRHIFTENTTRPEIQNNTPQQLNLSSSLSKINYIIPNTVNTSTNQIEPWILKTPHINTSLANHSKQLTNSHKYITLFNKIKHRYRGFKFIYTDATKMNQYCIAAIKADNYQKKYKMKSTTCSVFKAEAYAILRALEDQTHKIAICTDALSVIQEIQHLYTKTNIIQRIQDEIHRIVADEDRKVVLIWTPGHVGIQGNEEAHQIARNQNTPEEVDEPPTTDEVNEETSRAFRQRRVVEWSNTQNNKLRGIKDDIGPWPLPLDRREQVAITRLRIGHTRHTHEHLMKQEPHEQCETCNTRLTVEHIILECVQYEDERRRCQVPASLKDALSSPKYKNTINFITDTNIIKHI